MAAAYCIFWLLFGTGLSMLGGVSSYECYSQFCSTKGCMTPANAGKCTASDQFGCEVKLTVTVGRGLRWDVDCVSTTACSDSSTASDTVYTRTSCCGSNLCNINLPEVAKGSNQCYQYTCSGKDCNKHVIGNKTASTCPKTADGCFVRNTHTSDTTIVYDAGCSSATDTCTPMKAAAIDILCCKGDLCNDGQTPPPPTPNDKTSDAPPTRRVAVTTTAVAMAMALWGVAV